MTATKDVLTVFALIEANKLTGPVKNLLEFCTRSRQTNDYSPEFEIHCSLATFRRTGHDHQGSHTELVNACEATGVKLEFIGEQFRFDTRVLEQLRNLVENQTPNIIQTHNVKSHFLLRWSGLWRKYPWIAFHHGYATPDSKMWAYNRLDRWSLRAAHRVLTVSHSSARELGRIGVCASRLRVVHNAINPGPVEFDRAAIFALRRSLGISSEERVVLAAGRLSREKGHAHLVKAFRYLTKQHPNTPIRLVLAGDGPERHRLEAMTKSLNGNHRVLLPGHISDLRGYYAMADLMVLPSHTEGSPNVLLEAMAAGLPIVATSVGGVPEIVCHGQSAILVAPRKARALGQAMGLLLSNHSLGKQLSVNARQAVLEHHSPQARTRALVQIYRELVPSQAPVVISTMHCDSKFMGISQCR